MVRTLDAGADKPLPFLTNADEPNPALGVRGYRTDLTSPASSNANWRQSRQQRPPTRPKCGSWLP
ncbi:phosphoenolpyruvate-protein phosphotransferase [Arthrobacter sp. Hiyo8]|nr:phosphoenolpyruvate-protein phosphotransferase [Arthrobacter sp. Hiyo8]